MTFQKVLDHSLLNNVDRTAVEEGGKAVSYGTIAEISNKITNYLLVKDLGVGTVVGIQLDDRCSLISAMIGVLNARCVFVLIDGKTPSIRLRAMFDDINLGHLIVSRRDFASQLHGINEGNTSMERYFIEDMLDDSMNDGSKRINSPVYDPNDSIYIYFTSGSTGKPKGIVGKNGSLLQFVRWEIEEFNIDNTYRHSQLISPYFDAFLRDIFVPLVAGGTICIPPDEGGFLSPEKLISWVDDKEINLIHCVPSIFRIINNKNLLEDKFTCLRYIMLSGEKIVPSELIGWYETFGSRVQLINFYGATETTMIRSFYRIEPEDARLARIPIGEPIPDTSLLIVDENLEPCGAMVTGNLYIASGHITKGYLNDPELTYRKFIPYRMNRRDITAFRTGDKARKRANGKIELMGRDDRQIKLRGIRIEPEEVENVLFQSKLVKQATVFNYMKQAGEEILAGIIIPVNETNDEDGLKERLALFMKERLPAFMIPAEIMIVKEFPLLSNGKVDHTVLLNNLSAKGVIEPKNAIEERLLAFWKEVLGDSSISTETNFYQAGGTSLSLIKLVARVYNAYQVRIPLNTFFQNLTIVKQAKVIEMAIRDNSMTILQAVNKPVYELSSAQQRIYYHHQLDRDSTGFNLPVAWEVKEGVDSKKIENVIKALISRHESLRTEFRLEGSDICQAVLEKVDFNLHEIIDEGEDIKGALRNFIYPFDLARAPLIRAAIFRFKARSRTILIIDIHHIVCDGMSQIILFSDFLHLYNGDELRPLSRQYKDYAGWETGFKMTDEYLKHREFWLKSFETDPVKLRLPTSSTKPGEGVNEAGHTILTIEKRALEPALIPLKEKDVTTSSVLLAFYFMFLAQLTGQDDISVGVVSSGREQVELEGVVGMFAKTLPIRYKLHSAITFPQFVLDLHEYLGRAISSQVYDLIDIVQDVTHLRSMRTDGLFEAMFVYQNFDAPIISEEALPFRPYSLELPMYRYPITLTVSEDEERFYFEMSFAGDIFSQADIDRLAVRFKALIGHICETVYEPRYE